MNRFIMSRFIQHAYVSSCSLLHCYFVYVHITRRQTSGSLLNLPCGEIAVWQNAVETVHRHVNKQVTICCAQPVVSLDKLAVQKKYLRDQGNKIHFKEA